MTWDMFHQGTDTKFSVLSRQRCQKLYLAGGTTFDLESYRVVDLFGQDKGGRSFVWSRYL